MPSVVVGYGPDGQECEASAPKCLAQSRLREDGGVIHYIRSYGPTLVDPKMEVRYDDAPFVRVTPDCFQKYLIFLAGGTDRQFLAADREFREWAL
jgi:hypothetical protein